MPTTKSPHSSSSSSGLFREGALAVLHVAERLYRMDPEWVVFFREVLGVEGIVRRTFREPGAMIRFECSPEYARIREMLDELRNRQQKVQRPERHKHRVITVRMPRTLHETLKAEAEEMHVSVNTLCISKLMKLLDEEARQQLCTMGVDKHEQGSEADL